MEKKMNVAANAESKKVIVKEYISCLPEHWNYAALNGEQKKRLEDLLIERGVYVVCEDRFETTRLLNELVNAFCEGAGVLKTKL